MDTGTIDTMLSSPTWWFSVVLVGLILSIVAAFLVDALKFIYVQLRKTFEVSVARQKLNRARHIVILARNPELMKIELSLAIANMLKPISMLVVTGCLYCSMLFSYSYPDAKLELFHADPAALSVVDKVVNIFGLLFIAVEFFAITLAGLEATKISMAYTYMLGRLSKGKRIHRYLD